MISSFLIALREGMEAFLIVGIIISYLYRIKEKKYIKHVVFGTLTAIIISIVLAFILEATLGKLEGRPEQIFEGSAMFLAVAVLTYMIFWMNKQASSIRSDLEISVDKAVGKQRIFSIFFLGFISVLREGLETVLFFRAIRAQSSSRELLIGGILGIIVSIVIAVIFFISTVKIKISTFFKLTGILIILISAGLIAGGIHEFQEAGILPAFKDHIYDINNIISGQSVLGNILKSVLGYNPSPSLLETIVYLVYIILMIFLIRRFFMSKKSDNPH
ncbi:MAG: FTR1 family protein [Actinobacteria bacterium]|nr:FTR1 family protein [Actinomycetota bacterium]